MSVLRGFYRIVCCALFGLMISLAGYVDCFAADDNGLTEGFLYKIILHWDNPEFDCTCQGDNCSDQTLCFKIIDGMFFEDRQTDGCSGSSIVHSFDNGCSFNGFKYGETDIISSDYRFYTNNMKRLFVGNPVLDLSLSLSCDADSFEVKVNNKKTCKAKPKPYQYYDSNFDLQKCPGAAANCATDEECEFSYKNLFPGTNYESSDEYYSFADRLDDNSNFGITTCTIKYAAEKGGCHENTNFYYNYVSGPGYDRYELNSKSRIYSFDTISDYYIPEGATSNGEYKDEVKSFTQQNLQYIEARYCFPCENGKWAVETENGTKTCIDSCNNGYCMQGKNVCIMCPAGQACPAQNPSNVDLQCNSAPSCPVGSYSYEGQSKCTACPDGYTTRYSGNYYGCEGGEKCKSAKACLPEKPKLYSPSSSQNRPVKVFSFEDVNNENIKILKTYFENVKESQN